MLDGLWTEVGRGESESKSFAGYYCNEIVWTVGDTSVSINFLVLRIIF